MVKPILFVQSDYFRWIELVLIFIGIPLLYYFDAIPFHKSIPLLTVFGLLLFFILKDRQFNRKLLGFNGFKSWKPIIIRFIVIALLTGLAVWIVNRDMFFILPRERFVLWLMIMVFYPLWSAYPQEFIYRTWFFHRYRGLLKNETAFILVNALLFSFSHIIFRNWVAIIATFLGGIMFAYTYRKSNSLLTVFAEHLIYGNFIFTVGAGQYFYLPMAG
jgi:membrane protease YdiL (CAAX protease family)